MSSAGGPPGPDQPGRQPLPPELSPRRGRRPAPPPGAPAAAVVPGPRRRRGRWARFGSALAVVLSLLVLATSAAAYGYYRQLNGNITRADVFGAIRGHRPAKANGGAQNILVVGSDSRNGATPQQLQEANTTNDGGGINTDTIILLHIPAGQGQVTMISFPRDSWVAIPGHHMGKINSAYQSGESDQKGGGPALLVRTVEDLSGVRIDHFVEVNFFQFIDISNAVGGVQVCLTQPANDSHTNLHLPAGVSTIQGPTALSFVRQRYGLPNGDFSRIQRQQRFASALVHKAKSIRNPATLNALLQQATKSLTVDSGESAQDLVKLAERLRNVDPANIHFATIPTVDHGANHTPPGYSQAINYVTVDPAAVHDFLGNIIAGRDPNAAAPQPADSASPVPADQVHVDVRNGSGVAGRASSARRELTPYGFVVDSVGNAQQTSHTTIRYARDQAGAAKELSKAVRGARLVEDDGLGTAVQLIVGSDGATITDPSAPATPATGAPASPSAPPAGRGTAADSDCGP